MQQITKAQKALKDAGFDDWGEGADGLKEILTAMHQAVVDYANATEPLANFVETYFNQKTEEVEADD